MRNALRTLVVGIIWGCILMPTGASGGEWRESFDGGGLDAWVQVFPGNPDEWESAWTVADGLLTVRVASHLDMWDAMAKWGDIADLWKWKALSSLTNHLDVRMRSPASLDGKFGLFLGASQAEASPDYATGYFFYHHGVDVMRLTKEGVALEGAILATFFVHDWRLEFREGQFRLFSEELFPETWLLTEFVDADLSEVDTVGLLVTMPWVVGAVSAFEGCIDEVVFWEASVPDHDPFDVDTQERRTVTWGRLRHIASGGR